MTIFIRSIQYRLVENAAKVLDAELIITYIKGGLDTKGSPLLDAEGRLAGEVESTWHTTLSEQQHGVAVSSDSLEVAELLRSIFTDVTYQSHRSYEITEEKQA